MICIRAITSQERKHLAASPKRFPAGKGRFYTGQCDSRHVAARRRLRNCSRMLFYRGRYTIAGSGTAKHPCPCCADAHPFNDARLLSLYYYVAQKGKLVGCAPEAVATLIVHQIDRLFDVLRRERCSTSLFRLFFVSSTARTKMLFQHQDPVIIATTRLAANVRVW
eukprot:GEMP01061928.1.p1 GENE.GEMP01061928.1~~GEMP01061928.1.p1  ORF type:complete len:166 (+),score=16.26 GEMP01061928.1:170-667(+)